MYIWEAQKPQVPVGKWGGALLKLVRQNHVAGQRLDGEHAVFVDHIALGMIFLRQSGGTGIDVGHAVLFLHGEHVRVAVNQQVARLVRRQVIEVEQMAVGDESRAAIQIKEGQ